jgi:hypothetical protein
MVGCRRRYFRFRKDNFEYHIFSHTSHFWPLRISWFPNPYTQGQDGGALASTEGESWRESVAALLSQRSIRFGRLVSPILWRNSVVLWVAGQTRVGEPSERKMGPSVPDGPERIPAGQGRTVGRMSKQRSPGGVSIVVDNDIGKQKEKYKLRCRQQWCSIKVNVSDSEEGPSRRTREDRFEEHSILF